MGSKARAQRPPSIASRLWAEPDLPWDAGAHIQASLPGNVPCGASTLRAHQHGLVCVYVSVILEKTLLVLPAEGVLRYHKGGSAGKM